MRKWMNIMYVLCVVLLLYHEAEAFTFIETNMIAFQRHTFFLCLDLNTGHQPSCSFRRGETCIGIPPI